MKNQSCIILAAGRSQRFPSPMGKIVYPFLGKPLCDHSIELAQQCFDKIYLVVSPLLLEWAQNYYRDHVQVTVIVQKAPLGTWDALMVALPLIESAYCVVWNGDMPLLTRDLIMRVQQSEKEMAVVITETPCPAGYGRVLKDDCGNIIGIIEEKELISSQKYFLHEINAGLYKFHVSLLKEFVIQKSQISSEWYLTALWMPGSPALSRTEFIFEKDYRVVQGVNTWQDYETAEQYFYQMQRERLVNQGAVLENCQTILPSKNFTCAKDTYICGPAILSENVSVGSKTSIYPYSYLKNVQIESSVSLGPFIKITENSKIKEGVTAGTFVEIKRSEIGSFTKAKHFSYLADLVTGSYCNIGAFSVTCNFDGFKKNLTVLGSYVFIGASSQLIAPVAIDDHAYIGAGTTLTSDMPKGHKATRRAPLKISPYSRQTGEKQICAELSQQSAVDLI